MRFETTLPLGAPELMRVSDFERYRVDSTRGGEPDGAPAARSSRLTGLGPSLLGDLLRFEQSRPPGDGLEPLEVLAACVRHGRDLLIHLADGERVVPLTVFPIERLVHCPLPLDELLDTRLAELSVLHVEPALLRAPGHAERQRVGEPALHAPLGPVLWELALRGSREELLPEISGQAAYRLAPGVDLRGLSLGGTMAAAVFRLRRQTSSLREIAEWTGFDRSRAMRMLNGLYLQAGLMISRTHPAATNEGWFGSRT